MQPVQKTLRLKNNDDSDLSFDIEYAHPSYNWCLRLHPSLSIISVMAW